MSRMQIFRVMRQLWCGSPSTHPISRCECSPQTKSVSCHRKRLPSIPEGIPIETRMLDLSKNKLRIITPDNFSSFLQLEDLDLSDNLISAVEPGVLGQLPYLMELRLQGAQLVSIEPFAFVGLKSLQLLDVSQNRLDSLERAVFASPDTLQRLCLGGNPLVCDCRLLWLLSSHKPPSLQILDMQPECSAPKHLMGKILRELKEPLVSRYMTCTKPRIRSNMTQLMVADEGQPARLSCTIVARHNGLDLLANVFFGHDQVELLRFMCSLSFLSPPLSFPFDRTT
uniref:Uncharacterized protein n=1 Tax=Oryzias latipes TaxID=8090 RepID=A0A3P9JDP7_ORYLA